MHIHASSPISLNKGEIMFNKKEPLLVHYKHKNLILCEDCQCWKGAVFVRQSSVEQKREWIPVTCFCDGIRCQICHVKRPKPSSNIWRLKDEYFGHVPCFVGMRPCIECGGEMAKN